MDKKEIAAIIDKQDEQRYEWLKGLARRKDVPFIKRRAIMNYIRDHRTVLVVDRRQHSRGMKLVDADGDEIDQSVDVYSIVSRPHPEISICWHYTLKEAHDYVLTLGLKPEVQIYDLPTSTQ